MKYTLSIIKFTFPHCRAHAHALTNAVPVWSSSKRKNKLTESTSNATKRFFHIIFQQHLECRSSGRTVTCGTMPSKGWRQRWSDRSEPRTRWKAWGERFSMSLTGSAVLFLHTNGLTGVSNTVQWHNMVFVPLGALNTEICRTNDISEANVRIHSFIINSSRESPQV